MSETAFASRRAVQLESGDVRVTMLVEGGHIGEILHKPTGVNPLWVPHWPSIEPSVHDPAKHPEFGTACDAKLLAGIMGHNLCLDIFGGVSAEEEAAGLTAHGEASVAAYRARVEGNAIIAQAELAEARLRLERRIELKSGNVIHFTESVENLTATDRPVGWTQHVTLGPPFLEKGATRLEAPATRSKVYETEFAPRNGRMKAGAEFDWPHVPLKEGGTQDLRVCTDAGISGGYTAHLMDPAREHAYFVAWSPRSKVALAYVWKRADFPWLGIWEENSSREASPWDARTLTRGLEFGVSPMPETRRAMIERGSMFGVPCFRWIPARAVVRVDYLAIIGVSERAPGAASWDGKLG